MYVFVRATLLWVFLENLLFPPCATLTVSSKHDAYIRNFCEVNHIKPFWMQHMVRDEFFSFFIVSVLIEDASVRILNLCRAILIRELAVLPPK